MTDDSTWGGLEQEPLVFSLDAIPVPIMSTLMYRWLFRPDLLTDVDKLEIKEAQERNKFNWNEREE